MADDPAKPEQPFDPFKPAEPHIPGVPHKGEAPAAKKINFQDPKILAAGGGALLVLLLIAWMATRSSPEPPAKQSAAEPAPTAAAPAAQNAASPGAAKSPGLLSIAELSTLPAEVATTAEMAKPWAAKKFFFRHGTQRMPAVLLRLPTGSATNPDSYWAFSLQAPFGRCELEYVADLKRLASEFGYPSRIPMVVDPCTQTVFHPLQYGQIAGAYARGEIVRGSGLRPPLAIDLRIQGKSIIASRME